MRKPKSTPPKKSLLGASFRDPAGFVFQNSRGDLLRQINSEGMSDYTLLMESGLYKALFTQDLLIKHVVMPLSSAYDRNALAVIKPTRLRYISYPFEWSFSQLKDAALLTLAIQKVALEHGMILKDASAYNVQFESGKPIFIDTLSFEAYKKGEPWQAYRQFCQHFLAPLALMTYTDINLAQLLRVELDGIPLNLAAKLLPKHVKLKPGLAMHIVLHARAQQQKAEIHKKPSRQVSMNGLIGILTSLEKTIKKLQPPKQATEWANYYEKTNYSDKSADKKAIHVTKLVKKSGAKTVLDLGGNNGHYSRVLHDSGIFTVCTDIDPNAVEANYQLSKRNEEVLMLPLVVDLINPGGALGWQNQERAPIHERLQCDTVIALALIHHLAISNNLPFEKIAAYFKHFAPYLIIEFVPKSDSQVQKLLSTRKDIFNGYNEEGFKQAFGKEYTLLNEVKIKGSKRTLYLFKRK